MIKKRIIIDIEIKSNGPIYDADSEDGEGILFNDQQVESVTLSAMFTIWIEVIERDTVVEVLSNQTLLKELAGNMTK